MDEILRIASHYDLLVIEDAAQGVMSRYKQKHLGTIGHMGCYSFHETKNYNCGEGGALLVNDERFIERSEIIREKGTNRSKFFRGQVDKYTWVDLGSSYLPSEINAAFLYAQLDMATNINLNRLASWNHYYSGLLHLQKRGFIDLPHVPSDCEHNAHMFYIKTKDLDERTNLIDYLMKNEILSVFHYIPLHNADAGMKYGRFHGSDLFTTQESERLLRLPMYYNLKNSEIEYIVGLIERFYQKKFLY